MSPPSLPSVQRLIGLARSNGVDVRPTLLRVIVDQFVIEPRHSAAEVTRFGELVINLLPRAGEADRILVAQKLADHPQTPAAVARWLANDEGAVARPILSRSKALTDDDLFLAVRSGDAEKALAVAGRDDVGLAALVALEAMEDEAVQAALAARLRRLTPPPAPKPTDLGQRFLAAATAQRETILAELALEDLALPPDLYPRHDGREIETAALSRRDGALAEALARVFEFDTATAGAIAGDPGGEPLVVCARALDLGPDAAARILLFAHEAIGTSVERIYALAALYAATPRGVAVAVVRSWQAVAAPVAAQAPQRAGRHQPVMASDATDRVGARQAASTAARTVARQAKGRPGQTQKTTKG